MFALFYNGLFFDFINDASRKSVSKLIQEMKWNKDNIVLIKYSIKELSDDYTFENSYLIMNNRVIPGEIYFRRGKWII